MFHRGVREGELENKSVREEQEHDLERARDEVDMSVLMLEDELSEGVEELQIWHRIA